MRGGKEGRKGRRWWVIQYLSGGGSCNVKVEEKRKRGKEKTWDVMKRGENEKKNNSWKY